MMIFNPWLLLGGIIAVLAIALGAYTEGEGSGKRIVQAQFDQYKLEQDAAQKRAVGKVQTAADNLQSDLDKERKAHATDIKNLSARTARIVASLQHRAARPASTETGAAPAGPGPDGGSTGAGLYRDDGLFLVGKAELWQRIRLQRDACYDAYGRAQQAMKDLNAQLSAAH